MMVHYNSYKRLPPGGSVLSTFCGIIWQAAWTNRNTPHAVNHWLERASIHKGGTYVTRTCLFFHCHSLRLLLVLTNRYGDDKVADARAVCR
jgi:hypothetical protein